jgi:multisubunit Na+/H+ antiporter MnhB subunit
MIRKCFLCALISLTGSIAACFLFGVGLYVPDAAIAAAIVFVIALIFLFVAAIHYIREVRVALSSVRDEARDLRFMDLGSPPGGFERAQL